MTQDRIRRPPLDRTRPFRGRSPGAPDAAAGQSGATGGLDDVVSRSVELGYRVIDDYVQSGKRAAERLRRGEMDAGGLGDDAQDLGARMVRYASDLVATWAELLERGTGAAPAPEGAAAPAPERSAPRPADAPVGARVRVEVETRRRVAVTVELEPGAADRRLIAHALRASDPELPRVEDVGFAADAHGQTVLRIRIPDAHPPGDYLGLVADEATNLPLGTVEVRLAAAAD